MAWATKEPAGRALFQSQTSPSVGSTNTLSNSSSNIRTSPSANQITQVRDDSDTNAVTKRMLKMAVETNQIADDSINELELQNEKIKKQQDEVAIMGDQLNVADRKMKGIRSFFGHLGNQFRKDKSTEHQKGRQKYEKEYAKASFKSEEEKHQAEEIETKERLDAHRQVLMEAAEKDSELLKQAKMDSRQARKQGATPENAIFGKLVFQENEVPGELCEAEENLDEVGRHVKTLKVKAETMNDQVEESKMRIQDLHTDLNKVQDRTLSATKKGEKIIKNDSFF